MSEIRGRIASYLGNGGFFNPEHMEHQKARDLIIDCRDSITTLETEVARLRSQISDDRSETENT